MNATNRLPVPAFLVRDRLARTLALGLLLAAFLIAPRVQAQAFDPFIDGQTWYTDSHGLGILVDGGLFTIQLETNGVPGITAEDLVYSYPIEAIIEMPGVRNHRLSPSRRWVYIFGPPTNGVGTRVHFFRVPDNAGQPLEPVAPGETLAEGIAFEKFFDYDVPGLPALCGVVEQGDGFSQRIHWVNLESGFTGNTLNVGPNLGVLLPFQFAPNGIAAFVGYSGTGPGETTYELIELCDDGLGTSRNPTGEPWRDISGPVQVDLAIYPGSFAAAVQAGASYTETALDDCSTFVPPDTGACCLDGECLPGMTEDDCIALVGEWQGADTDCVGVDCPAPEPDIAVSGPGTTFTLQNTTYTVTCTNTGGIAASNAVAAVYLQSGAEFISASGGGVFDGSYLVTWNLGDLAPGAVVNFDLDLRAACGISQLDLNYNTITADGVGTVVGTINAMTSVIEPLQDPVGMFIQTTVPGGQPLVSDDTVVYDILMSSGADRSEISLGFQYGDHMVLDAVLNDGGGSWTDQGSSFAWIGDIPGGGFVQLSVRLRLSPCRTPTPLTTQLNLGGNLLVRNLCGFIVQSYAAPAALAVTPPDLDLAVAVTNVPAPRVLGSDGFEALQLVHAGVDLDLTWSLANSGQQPLVVSQAWLELSELIPAAEPPYDGTAPVGTSWDSGGNRVGWAGVIAPGDTVRIEVVARYPSGASCAVHVRSTAAAVGCAMLGSSDLPLSAVAAPWTESHLVTLDPYSTVGRIRPGIDPAVEPWICLSGETFNDINPNDDGSFWVGGLPCIRIDPVSLEVIQLGYEFFLANGLEHVVSAAEDPVSGLVYLAGYAYQFSTEYLRVRSWDPVTEQVAVVYDEPSGNPTYMGIPRGMEMDQDGQLAIVFPAGVLRLDPAAPASPVLLNDPSFSAGYAGLGLARDGRYLVAEAIPVSGVPEPLVAIEPSTGVHSVLFPDLNSGPGAEDLLSTGIAEGDDGRVYVVTYYGSITMVDLTAPMPTTVSLPGTYGAYAALFHVGGGPTSAVDEVPVPSYGLRLNGAAPNPFNPRTTIRFELPRDGRVDLAVYDLRGRLVARLASDHFTAGVHEVIWDGRDRSGHDAASGIYFSRLVAAGGVLTSKMVLAR